MLMRSPRYAHTDPLFGNNDILKLSNIFKFEFCKFIPLDFHKNKIFKLTPKSLAHSYNTRFNTYISLSHVQTNIAANFVLHKGMRVYNSLLNDLKCIDDFQKFRRTVKTFLLNI